jgi:hypothetical protein
MDDQWRHRGRVTSIDPPSYVPQNSVVLAEHRRHEDITGPQNAPA